MTLDGLSQARCPTCDMLVDAHQNNPNMPFCSERCRLIDLGRWLNEEHTLPCEADDQDEELEDSQPQRPKLPPGWNDA